MSDTGRELLEVADEGVREGFIFHLSSGTFLELQYWKTLLNYIIEDSGQNFFIAHAKLKKKNGVIAAQNERLFAYTSYLLVKKDTIVYMIEDWGLVTGQNTSLVQYYPEMDVELGKPLENHADIDAYFDPETGLHQRDFERGRVYVNPTGSSIDFSMPQEYKVAVFTGGGIVSSTGSYGGAASL